MNRKVKRTVVLALLILLILDLLSLVPTLMQSVSRTKRSDSSKGYAGSATCRECHEDFYELWATSHHGLAMQPYSDKFAAEYLISQTEEVMVGAVDF